jgi:cystathionine beta-lyase/cystathionine gamma-synthase
MEADKTLRYIKEVLQKMPADWLNLTTHRLDIYDEKMAKVDFLAQLEKLFENNISSTEALCELPTAYDYIRLGHPLSCLLEWGIAKTHDIDAQNVIGFSSTTTPILAILRTNLFKGEDTKILHVGRLPDCFDAATIKKVYGYNFETIQIDNSANIPDHNGSTILLTQKEDICNFKIHPNTDFQINTHRNFGSILVVNGTQNAVAEIQHFRRRETIAITPANTVHVLNQFVGNPPRPAAIDSSTNKAKVIQSIQEITGAQTIPSVGSSGLSIQYAIMMGLVDHALEQHNGKDIKFIVPPNCYGGTNDQARRVAACSERIEVMDLPVDGGQDMVRSIDVVLDKIAQLDAIPYIIAEIPTNPRVEVPDLMQLKAVLSKNRSTSNGTNAIAPIFILDQTFCPNVHFLGDNDILADVQTISYVSGSKFPSGGRCTAGYCIANKKAAFVMEKIDRHLNICDNEATALQYELLAEQLPSMNQRIHDAYLNTREFVTFVEQILPTAKINFVSHELAEQGFTPSVFSLDLPTKGTTEEERENHKRALNLKLINLMISEIPNESKFCVSYGQLKGCYWTIPATSTQGTTKEGDKDYIVRVALSASMDLEHHKMVFSEFVKEM